MLGIALSLSLRGNLGATTYGSVEAIANPSVIDTSDLRGRELGIRTGFASRLLQCGIVDRVIDALSSTGAISTIHPLNTHFAVGAGGFAGNTNPSYVYTVIDDGPNGASKTDIAVLTNALGYVLSQGSAFLLDADDSASFDFPANYIVLEFDVPPSLEESAALFEAVGRIDPELFATPTSGYSQYGRTYLSLQSAVPETQFIEGYVRAAQEAGVTYTPIVNGQPSLFRGGAAFPDNDWTQDRHGEAYLARIPSDSHAALGRVRDRHLRVTRRALRRLRHVGAANPRDHDRALRSAMQVTCAGLRPWQGTGVTAP